MLESWLCFEFVPQTSSLLLKFIYSEKATNFWEISTVDLSYVVMVNSRMEISQKFDAFSEYMNFTYKIIVAKLIKTHMA